MNKELKDASEARKVLEKGNFVLCVLIKEDGEKVEITSETLEAFEKDKRWLSAQSRGKDVIKYYNA